MKNSVRSTFFLIFLGVSAFNWAQEAETLDFGQYIGRIYSDGSGVVGERFDPQVTASCQSFSCQYERDNADANSTFDDTWSFHVRDDEMTDEQIITVTRKPYTISEEFGEMRLRSNIYLWINLSEDDQEHLCVSGHDYPDKNAMIRVGSNTAIDTNENGCVLLSGSLNSQMSSADTITIRGYHWPYDDAETFQISLGGYSQIMAFLRGKRSN